jgi:hypothetical protein
MDQEKIEQKLSSIAILSEDLSAELFAESPDTARKFNKIARYCRRIATCIRLYGQVPIQRQPNGLMGAAKTLDVIIKNVMAIADRLPNQESD